MYPYSRTENYFGVLTFGKYLVYIKFMSQNDYAKKDAILTAMAQIQKQYGTGAIMRLGERVEKFTTEVIPTGSIALDLALGVGGLPKGRIIEIYLP